MTDRNPFIGGAPEARDRERRERDMSEGQEALREDIESMKQSEPVRGWAIRDPNLQVILGTISYSKGEAWGKSPYDEFTKGYTVVPVEIREVAE